MNQVDIWYALPGAIRNPELLDGYRALLSADETARYERFFFDRDRHLHLVAWALVRTTLSRYVDVEPQDWEFVTNRHGRPEIAGPARALRAGGDDAPLRFNLSHTRGLVACVVAWGVDVGVDVEDRRRDTAGPEIARRFFSPGEVAAFERLPPERQEIAFFEYWTLKEAYIKAVGVGISLGLGNFSFALDHRDLTPEDPGRGPTSISFDGLDDDPADWQFAQYEPTPHHAMAVAIRRGHGGDREIRLREVVPGLDDG